MADVYCDLDLGTGDNNGTTWANAWQTFTLALTNANAGDVVFVQGTASEGNIATSPAGTKDNPVHFIGVANGTTNEPPTSSDVVANRAATLPIVNVTGTSDISMVSGFAYLWGIHFNSPDNISLITSSGALIFEECKFTCTDIINIGTRSGDVFVYWKNCTYIMVDVNSTIIFHGGVYIWEGGEVGGSQDPASALFSTTTLGHGIANIIGVDLSDTAGGPLVTSNPFGTPFKFINCKMGTSFVNIASRASLPGWAGSVESQMSEAGTSAANVMDLRKETLHGIIEHETTVVRSGGSSDGVTAISQKMTVDDNKTYEGKVGLRSFPIYGWLNQTTNPTTVTIYVHTVQGVTPGDNDRDNDEVWAELFYPGNDSSQYAIATSKSKPQTTPSALTGDTSNWNADPDDSQKIEFTLTDIDHVGPIYAYVYLAVDGTSVPSLYVDNALYIS